MLPIVQGTDYQSWFQDRSTGRPVFINQLEDPTVDGRPDENAGNNCGAAAVAFCAAQDLGVRLFCDEIKDAIMADKVQFSEGTGYLNYDDLIGFMAGGPTPGQPVSKGRLSMSCDRYNPTVANSPDGVSGLYNLIWWAHHQGDMVIDLNWYEPGSKVTHFRTITFLSDLTIDTHEPYGGGFLSDHLGHRISLADYWSKYHVPFNNPNNPGGIIVVRRQRSISNPSFVEA